MIHDNKKNKPGLVMTVSSRQRETLVSPMTFLSALLGIFLNLSLFAQGVEWQKYGYAKYLFSISDNAVSPNKSLKDQQVHLRLNNRLYFSDYLSAGLEFRLRAFQGSSVENKFITAANVITRYPYENLESIFWKNKTSLAYGQIDRLFVDYSHEKWQLTAGRQRISWGTSMVWNIIDLFNPQSVLDFDYEEKPGSDAIRIQYFTNVVGRLEFVYKPSPDTYERSAALLYLLNNWEYDFYFIAAWQRNKPLFGSAFTGDIYGAGIRGELKASAAPSRKQLGNSYNESLGNNFSNTDQPDISAVLSLDYTLPNSLYFHGEVLFNSLGKTENSSQYLYQSMRIGLLSAARSSLFLETAYQIHPLLRGNIFTLINPHENSIIYAPSLSWSVITNLDLYVIGLISSGPSHGEFSYFGRAFFLRTKYSF